MNRKIVTEHPNYGKLAMLHRMGGCHPIAVYAGTSEDTQKLYGLLQDWCNNSSELCCTEHEITTRNPMLAWHLIEFVKTQELVAPDDISLSNHGTVRFV